MCGDLAILTPFELAIRVLGSDATYVIYHLYADFQNHFGVVLY